MQTRKLGTSGLDLTVLGLGTWAIGGAWAYGWGAQNDTDSVATIIESLESGVNWIDTAAVYGLGHAEEIVGKALKDWREPVIVATKCGRLGDKNGEIYGCLKRESILREAEASLRRLGLEQLDLYQIHWPQPSSQIEEGFEALLELKRQGKIRYAGVSNFNQEQLDRVSGLGELVSLQSPYSFLKREIERRIVPCCLAHQVGLICYSPLQCGLLTGKASVEWVKSLPDDDWRKHSSKYFQQPELDAVIDCVDKLVSAARQLGVSVAELSLAWLLAQPAVTAAIVGARRPGQFKQMLKAASLTLDTSTLNTLEAIYEEYLSDPRHDSSMHSL